MSGRALPSLRLWHHQPSLGCLAVPKEAADEEQAEREGEKKRAGVGSGAEVRALFEGLACTRRRDEQQQEFAQALEPRQEAALGENGYYFVHKPLASPGDVQDIPKDFAPELLQRGDLGCLQAMVWGFS